VDASQQFCIRSRRLNAVLCLLAVALLQAPFARAAWLSTSMACCMGDHCPIAGHHHKSAAAENEMPMDCGHNMGHTADCKISCCKTADEAAIDVAQFVMPSPELSLSRASAVTRVSRCAPQLISRADKPQSPPPRTALS